MQIEELFTIALGLSNPWYVKQLDFDVDEKKLLIEIDFKAGARFSVESSSELFPVHATVKRQWQHLNFFQHQTTLKARVPRVKVRNGLVKTVEVPWAKAHSGFTLMMEAVLLGLAKVLPVAEVERQTGVSDDRIWYLLRKRVREAWDDSDWSELNQLGVDETSTKRGHKYGTAFMEIEGVKTTRGQRSTKVARLLYFTKGKGKECFESFVEELERRQVDSNQIQEIAMDMSPSFIAGAKDHRPEASLCFDRFHVMKLAGEACDEVRKEVVRAQGKLPKGAMWALRGNTERLKDEAKQLRDQLCKEHKTIGRALSIKDYLKETWNYSNREAAEEHLKHVISWAQRSRLKPFVKLARTLKKHWDGIMGYYQNYSTSGAIEALNGLLQLAKRRARGYRNFNNFRAIAYWIGGRLELPVLNTTTH